MWLMLAAAVAAGPRPGIRLEAESARLRGAAVATARPGYTGTGYVTGFAAADAQIGWRLRAAGGLYDAVVRYSAPNGPKGFELIVNGSRQTGMFAGTGDRFAEHAAGKIELRAGENEIGIGRGWGYFDIDGLELRPTNPWPTPRRPAAIPCDPAATPAARKLLRRLANGYGRQTLTGQYGRDDCRYVRVTTNRTPAILGADLMDYTPLRIAHGARPAGQSEDAIAAGRAGQIITLSWHWGAPRDLIDREVPDGRGGTIDARWYRGFYTNATTFDLAAALANPASEAFRLLLADIDTIAHELRKFADAGVPVLWRPLHEAEGGWFWWGARGPAAYIQLWRLLHERLTGRHGLHNLIWVHNSSAREWYPGDRYVDVVGVDAYPADQQDPLGAEWAGLQAWLNGRKILALTEFGGVPDIERMRRFGVHWAYFVSWTGSAGARKLTPDALRAIYRSPFAGSAAVR